MVMLFALYTTACSTMNSCILLSVTNLEFISGLAPSNVVLYLLFSTVQIYLRGPKSLKEPHITRVLGPPRPHITSLLGPPGPHFSRGMGGVISDWHRCQRCEWLPGHWHLGQILKGRQGESEAKIYKEFQERWRAILQWWKREGRRSQALLRQIRRGKRSHFLNHGINYPAYHNSDCPTGSHK